MEDNTFAELDRILVDRVMESIMIGLKNISINKEMIHIKELKDLSSLDLIISFVKDECPWVNLHTKVVVISLKLE